MVCRFSYYFQTPDNITLFVLIDGKFLPSHAVHGSAYSLHRKNYMMQALCIFHRFKLRHN